MICTQDIDQNQLFREQELSMVNIEREVESCTLNTTSMQYSTLDRSAFTAE